MRQALLSCADAFLSSGKLSANTLGRYAAGEDGFFDGLRREEKPISPGGRRFDRVMGWFDTNWPADLAEPESLSEWRALRSWQAAGGKDIPPTFTFASSAALPGGGVAPPDAPNTAEQAPSCLQGVSGGADAGDKTSATEAANEVV